MAITTTTKPRIYVACLASYNAGGLHGAWIDADQTEEEIFDEIKRRVLDTSPEPGAEEFAIHDYEGFGPLKLGEYATMEYVSQAAAGIAEHGEAFAAWLDYDSYYKPSDVQDFRDAYRGEWGSVEDYAEALADECGLNTAIEKLDAPFSTYVKVDIEQWARDIEIESTVIESGHYTVYVFDA